MDDLNKHSQRTIGSVFEELVQTYHFCMQRTLSKYGLYAGQPAVLFALKNAQKPTQNELAGMLNVSKASVGVSLKRMERSGFIKRAQDKTDSRCNRIALTKKGEEFARWCEIDYDMIYSTMLASFDGDERQAFLELLERMLKGLSELKTRIQS
ncbi:MAG: MarR family winged helix-turn-helix transcriptional regulator [Bacillota bacterium]